MLWKEATQSQEKAHKETQEKVKTYKMASIYDLPKGILNYLPLDPKDKSLLRATCKHIHSNIKDTAEKYRACKTHLNIRLIASDNNHADIVRWCMLNNMDKVTEKSAEYPHVDFGPNPYDWTLYYACRNGYLDIAKLCVKMGARNFNDALGCACTTGQLRLARWCISNGATYKLSRIKKVARKYNHLNIVRWCTSEQLKKRRRLK